MRVSYEALCFIRETVYSRVHLVSSVKHYKELCMSSFCFCLAFAHLARTAFRALALRSSGVIFAALAGPPLRPPLRPRATAAGSFSLFGVSVDDMPTLYVTALEKSTKISGKQTIYIDHT
jgi:hypothetical protein